MTLKDLSRLLGLSPTTVSRALAGYPDVREATRTRVREAAARHGYRPNRRAAALATGRAMSIGHVFPVGRNRQLENPVLADFLAGAGGVYAAAGYDLTLSIVPDEGELAAFRQMAAAGSVDGFLVSGPRRDDPRLALLRELGLPFVVHGRVPGDGDGYSFVDIDNRRAFARATAFLLDLGHRRIGLLNGPEETDYAARRATGHAEALARAALPLDPTLSFSGVMSEANGHAAAIRMLAGPLPPTAFLVSSLVMAIGARRAVQEVGLDIPRDVSMVVHDDMLGYLKNGEAEPIFTATQSSVRDAGARCAEILLGLVGDPGQPPVREVWTSRLVLGRSTGPAPTRREADET
jgi:LacI family transcriptional regulator